MTAAPLKRRPVKNPRQMPFVGELCLGRGRVHEFCGPSRVSAAMLLARGAEGPVLWISQAHGRETLNPDGACAFVDPGRLIFVTPERGPDLLWTMEEALRSGVINLVIADLPQAPALTPVLNRASRR